MELKAGDAILEVEIYDDGSVEITVSRVHHSWNDGGRAIAGDIVLDNHQAGELMQFLCPAIAIMDEIEQMLPLSLESQEDRRCTWPERWSELRKQLDV